MRSWSSSKQLNQEQGITIVFVTHDPETADYCHRVIHVRDGVSSLMNGMMTTVSTPSDDADKTIADERQQHEILSNPFASPCVRWRPISCAAC